MMLPIWITAFLIPLLVGGASGFITAIYKDRKEDSRRKNDLERATNERARMEDQALREKQKAAIANFIRFVRDEETSLHTDYRDTVTTRTESPKEAITNANIQIERNARFWRNLVKAWDLLDLEVSNPEVRESINRLEIAISHLGEKLSDQMDVSNGINHYIPVLSFTNEFLKSLNELKQKARENLLSPNSNLDPNTRQIQGMFT